MVLTNSFRYGEISRKQAGNFMSEGYQQGSFRFRNARTLYDGGMTRRYPVKSEITIDANTQIWTIHGFDISDNVQWLIGIGVEKKNGANTNVIVIWRYETELNGIKLKEKMRLRASSDSRLFTSKINGNSPITEVPMTEIIAKSIRFAQFYDRLYIASHYFRTFFLESKGENVSAYSPKFFFNQDAKNKIYYIPSEGSNGEGKILYYNNYKYYESLEDMEAGIQYSGDTSKAKKATSGYTSNFADYEDDYDLNTYVNTYPSVVAIINESIYFANTINNPNTFWKSRNIGSSQWVSGYSSDTMHDFTNFEVVATEQTELKDTSEWPMTNSEYCVTEHAQDVWYVPENTVITYKGHTTTAKAFEYKLSRERQYWNINSQDNIYYYSEDGQANAGKQYTWSNNDAKPIYDTSSSNPRSYKIKISDTEYRWLDNYPAKEVYPYSVADNADQRGAWKTTDFIWRLDDGTVYDAATEDRYPVKQFYKTYDLTNAEVLYETKTSLTLVATSSCGIRLDINSGSENAIKFISAGCDKIIVGTSTSEWTMPANFNAVENKYVSNYSTYGSLSVEPIKINKSFFFLQRGKILREFYLYNSYLMSADVTALNHDIFPTKVIDCVGLGAPDPVLYYLMDNGELVQIMYDRDGGLNSMAHWHSGYDRNGKSYRPFSFHSLATMRHDNEDYVLSLVSDSKGWYICSFDETTDKFIDKLGTTSYEYDTLVETVYTEVNNNQVVFGRFKKAKSMWLRPYECGHIMCGNDERSLTRSNYALENKDYYAPILGKSDRNFSMVIRSVGDEPMTILAMAWEIDNG